MNPLTEAAFILAFCILPGGGECPKEAVQSGCHATVKDCKAVRDNQAELLDNPEDLVIVKNCEKVTDCEVKK